MVDLRTNLERYPKRYALDRRQMTRWLMRHGPRSEEEKKIMVQSDAGTTRLLFPKGPKTFEPCQMAAHTLEGMYEECFDALKA